MIELDAFTKVYGEDASGDLGVVAADKLPRLNFGLRCCGRAFADQTADRIDLGQRGAVSMAGASGTASLFRRRL
ncbi:hypothetical protein [Novipirellula aureliae]|uniref:hypothetical protein n=1 Tax=Novipirellula aureliae TaxID=2527966 RepID=UPI0018CCB982|nr:hypothetical protein [Novipirellula aureliae]